MRASMGSALALTPTSGDGDLPIFTTTVDR